MARMPKADDRDRMRRRLAMAAYDVIAEIGYDAVTLERVAQRAAVSKGLLLYYFTSKEELLAAAMDQLVALIRRRIQQAISRTEDPLARLDAYLGAITWDAVEHRKFYRVYLDFLGRGSHHVKLQESTQAFVQGCEAFEQEIVMHGLATGVFRLPGDPRDAVQTVRAMIDGMSIRWALDDGGTFSSLRARLRTAIYRYLGAAPDSAAETQP